jgi:hypothetical protein
VTEISVEQVFGWAPELVLNTIMKRKSLPPRNEEPGCPVAQFINYVD